MPATVLGDLALMLSLRSVAGVEPLRFLREAAGQIAQSLDVAGAVLVVPTTAWVGGSDDVSTLVGEMQLRDGQGPLVTAMRTARPMLTPDLTRIGPPPLAALAADVGFSGSAALALLIDGRVVAGLQVIGRTGRPIEPRDIEALDEVADVLAARIADLVEIARLRHTPVPPAAPAPTGRDRTEALPAQPDFVPVPLNEAPPELVTQALRTVASNVVPLPRCEAPPPPPRPSGSRHRRES